MFARVREQTSAAAFNLLGNGGDQAPVMGHRTTQGVRADRWLLSIGIPQERVKRVFDLQTGNLLIKSEKPPKRYYDMQVDELNRYLGDRLEPYYDLVSSSLDESKPGYGFNRHDKLHIEWVVNSGLSFLRAAQSQREDITDETLKDFVIAAWLHDIGNLFSRDEHPKLGLAMGFMVLPGLKEEVDLMKGKQDKLEKIIFYHEEPAIKTELAHFDEERTQRHLLSATMQEQIAYLRREFPPELLALIMADKFDVNQRRFSYKASRVTDPMEALQEDAHLLLSLFLNTYQFYVNKDHPKMDFDSGIGLSRDGTTFTWKMNFVTDAKSVPAEQRELFKAMMRHLEDEERARLGFPPELFELYKQKGIPMSDLILSKFWQKYFYRVKFAIEAASALYPKLTKFNLQTFDHHYIGSETGNTTTTDFSIANLDRDFMAQADRYNVPGRKEVKEASRRRS